MIEETRYSKKINPFVLIAFVIVTILLLLYLDRAIAQEKDQKAVDLAQKTIDAMGGMDGWKNVNTLRFNFQVERPDSPPRSVKHLWDHKNGKDHVEGSTKEGKAMVAWVDLTNKSGVAWQDGKKLEGEELKKALEWAYGRWVNDTYWLIMPFKLLDPGVNLKYEGKKGRHEVLHVSFGKVGLTPGDQYWAFINPESGLMERWEFLLQDEKEKSAFDWKEWIDVGGVKLSKAKEDTADKTIIRFEPLRALDSADASFFGQDLKLLE